MQCQMREEHSQLTATPFPSLCLFSPLSLHITPASIVTRRSHSRHSRQRMVYIPFRILIMAFILKTLSNVCAT